MQYFLIFFLSWHLIGWCSVSYGMNFFFVKMCFFSPTDIHIWLTFIQAIDIQIVMRLSRTRDSIRGKFVSLFGFGWVVFERPKMCACDHKTEPIKRNQIWYESMRIDTNNVREFMYDYWKAMRKCMRQGNTNVIINW